MIIIGFGRDSSLVWVEGDAENLSFQNDSMDGYTIAFGIRNVTHIEKVLSEAYRWVSLFEIFMYTLVAETCQSIEMYAQ